VTDGVDRWENSLISGKRIDTGFELSTCDPNNFLADLARDNTLRRLKTGAFVQNGGVMK
jgi:hypothetical protein